MKPQTSDWATKMLIYHNMDLGFAFLDDERSSQCQAFITVVVLQSLPQTCDETVLSCSPASLHLQNLWHI